MGDEKPRVSLDELDVRLRKARSQEPSRERGEDSGLRTPMSGLSMAFRISVELVSALGVGVGIGLLLDRWLGTAPWFLIVFCFLGMAAGVLNVYRVVSGIGYSLGYRDPSRPDAGTEEDKTNGAA